MTENALDALCAALDEWEKQPIRERDTIGSIYHREPTWTHTDEGMWLHRQRSTVRAVNPSPAEIFINGQRITAHVGDIVVHHGEPVFVPGTIDPVAHVPPPIRWETDIAVSPEEAQQIDQLLRMGNVPIEIRTQRGGDVFGRGPRQD